MVTEIEKLNLLYTTSDYDIQYLNAVGYVLEKSDSFTLLDLLEFDLPKLLKIGDAVNGHRRTTETD